MSEDEFHVHGPHDHEVEHAAHSGDPASLEAGRRGGDVRVEPAGRASDQVYRNGLGVSGIGGPNRMAIW